MPRLLHILTLFFLGTLTVTAENLEDSINLPPDSSPEKTVLFDGSNLDKWTGMSRDGERQDNRLWNVVLDRIDVGGVKFMATEEGFGDCFLHVKWLPWSNFRTDKDLDGQGRGNSGVFLMKRYEVQILDSFQNETYPDGMAGALYAQYPPLVNACYPPGYWQSFDILFHAPRFDDAGNLVAPARKTVLHNGVVIHHDQVLLGDEVKVMEGGEEKKVQKYVAHPPREPVTLQNHGSGVSFRDIWLQEVDYSLNPKEAQLLRSRLQWVLDNRQYRRKDRNRPQPPVIRPGLDGSPPSDAVALVLPNLTQEWQFAAEGMEWEETPAGQVLHGTARTQREFRNAQVHLEWRVLNMEGAAAHPPALRVAGVEFQLSPAQQPDDGWNSADILVSVHQWEIAASPVEQQRVTVFCNNRFIGEISRQRGEDDLSWDEITQWPLALNDPAGSVAFRNVWVRGLGSLDGVQPEPTAN